MSVYVVILSALNKVTSYKEAVEALVKFIYSVINHAMLLILELGGLIC